MIFKVFSNDYTINFIFINMKTLKSADVYISQLSIDITITLDNCYIITLQ